MGADTVGYIGGIIQEQRSGIIIIIFSGIMLWIIKGIIIRVRKSLRKLRERALLDILNDPM